MRPGCGTLSGVSVSDPAAHARWARPSGSLSEDAGGRNRLTAAFQPARRLFRTDRLKPGQLAATAGVAGRDFCRRLEQPRRRDGRPHDAAARCGWILIFASLDTLQRHANRTLAPAEPDDWKWVLRSSAAARTASCNGVTPLDPGIYTLNTLRARIFPSGPSARADAGAGDERGVASQDLLSNLADSPRHCDFSV